MEHERKIPVLLRKIDSIQQSMEAVNKQRHVYKRQIKQLSRMKVVNNTSERYHVNVQETIKNLNQEVVNAQEQMMAQKKERDETHNELMETKAKIYEIMDEMDKGQSGGTEITKEILKLHEQEQQGKVLRVDIVQKLQSIEKLVTDVQKQLSKLKCRLKHRDIPLKVYRDEELSIYKAQDLENVISCLDEQIQATTPNFMPECCLPPPSSQTGCEVVDEILGSSQENEDLPHTECH